MVVFLGDLPEKLQSSDILHLDNYMLTMSDLFLLTGKVEV